MGARSVVVLGGEDSNPQRLDQNQLCCQLHHPRKVMAPHGRRFTLAELLAGPKKSFAHQENRSNRRNPINSPTATRPISRASSVAEPPEVLGDTVASSPTSEAMPCNRRLW